MVNRRASSTWLLILLVDSVEARMAVGPSFCTALRCWIHAGGVGGEAPRPLARGIERFRGWMQQHHINPDSDYARFYEHYFLKLPQQHLEILDEELIRTLAIVGSPEECLERVRALAQVGVTDFALILGGNAHELIAKRCPPERAARHARVPLAGQ